MENKQLHQVMVDYRRHFHQHPEVSNEEVQTRAFIQAELEKLGLTPKSFTGKDVYVDVEGDAPGKLIVIRSDIDALPITEETNLPFQSQNAGVMHACGHDGHMAVLLGMIHRLLAEKPRFNGTIRFLFQHAEEVIPGGAKSIVEAGGMTGVDAIFGYHLWQPFAFGKVGIRSGAVMAGADRFKIEIYGKGGHGSMPNDTIDPTIIAAQVITQLQTIISRSLHPLENAVISIGELKSGTMYNVIPDKASIVGTVRQFGRDVSRSIHHRMEKILQGICLAHDATYELTYDYGDPALVNDEALYEIAHTVCLEQLEKSQIHHMQPILGSEDFAYYTEVIPGFYYFIGAQIAGQDYGHHHPKFDFHEEAMMNAMTIVYHTALQYLCLQSSKEVGIQ